MLDLGNLRIGIVADSDKAIKQLANFKGTVSSVNKSIVDFGESMKSIGSKMSSMGSSLTTKLSLPLATLGTGAVKLASDFEESLNKVNVTFGNSADEVEEWSKDAIKNMGMAQGSALEMVSLFGDMGQGMGLNSEQTLEYSKNLVQLSADLASFKNVSVERAQSALSGIYTGETEALKSMGIVMTDVNLQEYALANGINKKTSEMTQAEKVQLRYNFVMDATKNAHGDFANTSDGTANSLRIFTETIKELGTQLGQVLLPIVTPIIQKLTEWVQKFSQLDEETKKIILTVAGIVAAIGPVLVVGGKLFTGIGSIISIVGKASTSITAMGGVMALLTNPITIAIAAITAIIGVITYFYNTNEEVKNSIDNCWKKIKEVFVVILDAIKSLLNAFIQDFKVIWDKWGNSIMKYVQMVMNTIGNVFKTAFTLIGDLLDVFIKLFTGDWAGLWESIKTLAINLWNNIGFSCKQWLNDLIDVLKSIIPNMIQAGKDIFNGLWDGIKSIWNSIASWVNEKVSWLIDKITFWDNGKNKINGSHRTGLKYVPFDGYIAELHKGERVLTANEARKYDDNKLNGETKTINQTLQPIFNIYSSSGNPKEISKMVQKDLINYNRALGIT